MIQQRDTINNSQRVLNTILILLVFASSSGCWVVTQFRNKFGSKPECVLGPDISKSELIHHLNQNISPLVAWKSSDVRIHTKTPGGIPLRISADMAVESPRNFRLIAKSIAGKEADIGSNDERFWFWLKRGQEKRVITVKHEDLSKAQQRMQMPFQPDWIMEAFGVIPIDESNITIENDPSGVGILQLISKQKLPTGQPVRRIIEVDTCRGYILAQSLYAENGNLIAKATLNNYKRDKESGLMMPHEIFLNWPQNKMQMKLVIGEIEVNPEDISKDVWTPPNTRQAPRFDFVGDSNHFPAIRRR